MVMKGQKLLDYQYTYYRNNAERLKAKRREYYAANKERCIAESKGYQLRRNYGMTVEDLAAMLSAQGGRCAMCGTDEPGGRNNQFHVDHCHATGKVRGLLCVKCNMSLGWYEANREAMVRYLAKADDIEPGQAKPFIRAYRRRKDVANSWERAQ